MSNSSKSKTISQGSHDLHEVIEQSQKLASALLKSNQLQKQYYLNIQSSIDNTLSLFKKKFIECQTNLEEIQIEWDKVRKFVNNGPGFLKAKLQEIKSKSKNIDSVISGIKETVSKIKPQALIELPVNKVKSIQHLFKTLFFILYHQNTSQFNWDSFKTLALELENGEDFISRLVNVHFKDFKQDEYEALMILKNDAQFDNTVVNSPYSHDLLDLADWLEYVCVGHKFSLQMKEAEKAYEKIRRDMHRREGSSVEASKNFWKEALEEVDRFQMSLLSYESELKAFEILTDSSIETIQERIMQRNKQIKAQ